MTTATPSNQPVIGVNDVLITAELASRPSRAPDYKAENRAFGRLAQEMTSNPGGVLQTCAELVMELCHADSAGVSILEPGGRHGIFRWHAAVGRFAPNLHGTMPREASPCGTVLDRNRVLLFKAAERFFPAMRGIEPRVYENLLAPWQVNGEPVGTLWAIKHTPEGHFDAEDARLLRSLACFASAAFQMNAALNDAKAGQAELEQRVEERTTSLREKEARLADDLAGMRRLHELHARIATEIDLKAALDEILVAACEFTGTDRGCVQLVSDDGERLEMFAWRGYADDGPFVEHFRYEGFKQGCDVARVERRRLIIADTRTFPGLEGTADGAAALADGIFAAQSTPMVSRMGETVGVLSTQFRQPHRPKDEELRLIDLLAWTAADFVGRHRAEKSLRESEDWLAGQKEAFQAALGGAPLDVTLEVLIHTVVNQLGGGLRCALYMVDRNGAELHHVAGMSEAYAADVDGFKVGPDSLACGLAVHTGKPVITPDVTREPRWRPWLWLAQEHGYRACWSFPVETAAGKVVGTLAMYFPAPREPTRHDIELATALTRAAGIIISRHQEAEERARVEAALRASEERYRIILESARDYAIFSTDTQGRIETWPPGAEAVFGWTAAETVGQDAAITFTPEDRGKGVPQQEIETARREGVASNVRCHLRKDGQRVFIDGRVMPLRNQDGRLRGFLKIGQDVTEQRVAEEALRASEERLRAALDTEKVLVAELQHRTRNLIGVVRSISDRTLSTSLSLDDFQDRFRDRMAALGRVNGMLSRLNESDRISFDELLRAELAGHGAVDEDGHGPQVTLEGPKGVRLRSATVQTFALGLHELSTNAVKYGALSRPEGRLHVRWHLIRGEDGDQRLRVEWQESSVPVMLSDDQPLPRGYGRDLIERALPYQLGAETAYDLMPDGVRCTITLPISTTHKETEHA